MDPINLLMIINLGVVFYASAVTIKKAVKFSDPRILKRPKTYLQSLPPNLAALTVLLTILSVFQIGTLEYKPDFLPLRMAALIIYILSSWLQVYAQKSLGKEYSQDVVLFRDHKLVINKAYKLIRHPQYMSQIITDLAACVALMSFLILPLVIIEIPFLILRARLEEKMFTEHFKEAFAAYKKRTSFFFPFL